MVFRTRHKILYVDNFNNFYVYRNIALRSTHEWVFLVFDEQKALDCAHHGLHYHLMPKHTAETTAKDTLEIDKADLQFAIERDRILKFLPRRLAKAILLNQCRFFTEKLLTERPNLIIGEISWGNEYLFFRICRNLGFRYRHLLNLPLKENRIVFFDDEHSISSLLENPPIYEKDGDQESYYSLCEAVRLSQKNRKFSLSQSISNFFSVGAQLRDYRKFSLYYKIHYLVRGPNIAFQNIIYKFVGELELPDLTRHHMEGRKIVFFPLHIQPESTPDFVHKGSVDQLRIGLELAQQLGSNGVLLLKDHPNKKSVRNLWVLLRLFFLKNVIILNRDTSSKNIIQHSDFVVTIAGSAALEARLLDKQAIVLSNVFYGGIRGIARGATNFSGFNNLSTNEAGLDVSNLEHLGAPAIIHDPMLVPSVQLGRNLDVIDNYIGLYIEKMSQS